MLEQGVFLPVFKKLKAAFKKTQADFWQKIQGYGGNFGYQEKNSIFFRLKPPKFFQKLYEFSLILRNFPKFRAIFVDFSYKTKNFPKYFR